MKAFRRIYKFYESREWTKRLMIGITESWNRTFFATVSQEKKAFLLWSCAAERRKLHGERNNAKYYFWLKKKRKTKNILAG